MPKAKVCQYSISFVGEGYVAHFSLKKKKRKEEGKVERKQSARALLGSAVLEYNNCE